MDNFSFVWIEEESIDNQKMEYEIEKLKDIKLEILNQIIYLEVIGRIQVKQIEESYVYECKRFFELIKDGMFFFYFDRVNIVEIDEEEFLKKV